MCRCMNNKCNANPLNSMYSIIVTMDGDMVCDKKCNEEYTKQKKHFFDVTCHSEELTTEYLLGE